MVVEQALKEDREMPAADFIVCLPAADEFVLLDNVVAVCCHCGCKVQHRPYVPPKVKKLCTDCALAKMEEDGDADIRLTKQAQDDILNYLKRHRH
jgi:hypothetical protein